MIFATKAAEESRARLTRAMASGAMSDEEGCRRILESDPDDVPALRYFAEAALEKGDLAEAASYARLLIRAHPLGYEGHLQLSRALTEGGDPNLGAAYCQTALVCLQYDEDSLPHVDLPALALILGCGAELDGLPKPEALTRILEFIQAQREGEPAEVTRELEPYRLIQHMFESSDQLLERPVVDSILQRAADSAPLLLGILKEWGAGALEEEDRPLVERALALLGEIGDPAALAAIAEFLVEDEDDLSGPADWAFRRIAFQNPEAALRRIREMIPTSGGVERFALAQQIGAMPEVAGRTEALVSLTAGIDHIPRDERQAVTVAAIANVMMVEGGDSFLAASLEKQFAELLDGKARSDLRKLRQEALVHGPLVAAPSDFTIHEICCEEPEDGGEPPPVARQSRPGRNDPCWCGSGKKYKKCHLERDERH